MVTAMLGLVGLFGITSAHACGYCVEDKIAAVYDHTVITQALANKHQVAFFALEGNFAGTAEERRMIEHIAHRTYGVDMGSAHASPENAALSVAFNPARVSLLSVQHSLRVELGRKKIGVSPLRVLPE